MNRVASAIAATTARVVDIGRGRRAKLPELLAASECPADLLDGLATLVGLRPLQRPVDGLDPETLRALVSFAPYLWSGGYTPDVFSAAVRVVTRRRSHHLDWHGRAFVAGGALPVIGTLPLPYGANQSLLFVEDPHAEQDLQAVADVVDLIRPIGSRVDIVRARLVEPWHDMFRWRVLAGSADLLDLGVRLSGSAAPTFVIHTGPNGWLAAALFDAELRIFQGASAGFFVQISGADSYGITVQSGGTPVVTLSRNGVFVASVPSSVPVAPATCLLRVAVQPTVTGARISVILDGLEVITYDDPAPLTPPGQIALSAASGDVDVLWVHAMDILPDIITVQGS